MWAQWQGVRMLNCFVLHVPRLYCLCREHVYEARLRGELPGLKVTKCPHLDQDSRNVLPTTQDLFHFCFSHAAAWSYRPYLEITACLLGSVTAVTLCNLFRNSNGTDMTCVTYPDDREHAKSLLIEHAPWGVLIGEAAIADASARVGLALPRRCQQQLAKQAPCQPAWPPCLWMVLLSKVAVRTLERAAINTT